MRTAIKGGWIVGHQGGRHALIRDGVVVYEGNKIIHVGKDFDGQVDKTIDTITTAAKTGQIGDGKIFVLSLDSAVRIRTGETDAAAL